MLALLLLPAPVLPIIFADEFDRMPSRPPYFEVTKPESFVHDPTGGIGGGGAMKVTFRKGQVEAGGLKILFGRSAFGKRAVLPDRDFRDIYWRVYVKHEKGWEGSPAKLARTTTLMSNWSQGHIAHVWSMGDVLGLDPATGIQNNRVATTRYNDFPNIKWLGIQKGKYPIFSTAESGKWVCVEAHVKLNTPGKSDGVFELWINDTLEASRHDLNWHGSWQDYGINAFFLENYWNDGSVKTQSRWFDRLAISTSRIGMK